MDRPTSRETPGARCETAPRGRALLFNWLITGQVLPTNSAAAVRGPKYVVKTGKTPLPPS
jgi:hypothetical protein